MFVDNRLLNICVKGFYLGLEIGLEAEAKTLEAEARTLEAEAEARTLEAEAEAGYFGLEAEAKPRGLTSLVTRVVFVTKTSGGGMFITTSSRGDMEHPWMGCF